MRALVAVVLLAALGGVALVVRAQRDDGAGGPISVAGAPTSAASAEPDAGVGALDDRKPVKGQPAPDFVLRNADGALVKLSDLRGKVVFVNFWASWCVPCKKELPDIQKLYDEKRADGLEVLAINWQDDPATAAGFFAANSLDPAAAARPIGQRLHAVQAAGPPRQLLHRPRRQHRRPTVRLPHRSEDARAPRNSRPTVSATRATVA